MSTLQANTLVNSAGTGAPNFTNGLTLAGGTTLSAYEQGTWTPAEVSKSNLSGSGSFTNASYTRIGNMVFARLELVTGYSVTTTDTNTVLTITTSGLPGLANSTPFYGTAATITGATYVTSSVSDSSGSNTNFQINWVSNGTGSITIGYLSFTYTI